MANSTLAHLRSEDDRDFLHSFQYALEGRSAYNVALLSYESKKQLRHLMAEVQELLPDYHHVFYDFIGKRLESLTVFLDNQPELQPLLVARDAEQETPPTMVHIFGMEGTLLVELGEKAATLLPALNVERDYFFRRLPFVKVLWVTPWERKKIRQETIDFHSWVNYEHHFKALPEEAEVLDTTPSPPPVPYYSPERRKYVQSLEKRYDELPLDETVERQREAADLMELLGEEYIEAWDIMNAADAWSRCLAHLQRAGGPSENLTIIEIRYSDALIQLRQFEEAKHYLQNAADRATSKKDWELYQTAILGYVKLYKFSREFEKAEDKLREALSIAEQHALDLTGVFFQLKGNLYLDMRQSTVAAEAFYEAILQYKEMGEVEAEITIFHDLGRIHLQENQFRKAIEINQHIVNIASDKNRQQFLHAAYYHIGVSYSQLGEYSFSLAAYKQALAYGEQMNFAKGHTLHAIGLTYIRMAQIETALPYFQEAINKSQLPIDFQVIADSNHQIGVIYATWYEFQEALNHLESALDIVEKYQATHRQHRYLFDIGVVYARMGDVESAQYYYQTSISSANEHQIPEEERNDTQTALFNLSMSQEYTQEPEPTSEAIPSIKQTAHLAHHHLAQDQPEAALPLFAQALELFAKLPKKQQVEDQDNLAQLHLGLGCCYLLRAGKLTRSEPEKKHLQQAYDLALEMVAGGDQLSTALLLETGYWLLISLQKELKSWFSTKAKKLAWKALHTQLVMVEAHTEEAITWQKKIIELA